MARPGRQNGESMRRVAVGLLLLSLVAAALLLLNDEGPGRRRNTARGSTAPGTDTRDPSGAHAQSGAEAAATSTATEKHTRAKVLGSVGTWDEDTGEERMLPGARVQVFRITPGLSNDDEVLLTENPLELHATATAGAKGEFSFDLAPEPEWGFRAEAEGFAPAVESIQGPGKHELELRLVRARVRAVRVVDQEDRPVAAAEVFVYHEGGLPMSRHVAAADGSVALPLPEDDATLFVRAHGYALSYIEDVHDMLERAGYTNRNPNGERSD